jgi:hypothetical protein
LQIHKVWLRDFRPANGEHVAAVGSVAVAPEGMFAYLPDADASRRWMIDQVLDKTRLLLARCFGRRD